MLSDLDGIEIVGHAQAESEAKEKIRQLKPDAVILDIRLKEGSGMDVLRDIMKDNHSPVAIILTNYPYPQYRSKCMEMGADFFLDKSKEFEDIPGILKKLKQDSVIGNG
jgi:DNA-binding NarL/FixJ family response regulator